MDYIHINRCFVLIKNRELLKKTLEALRQNKQSIICGVDQSFDSGVISARILRPDIILSDAKISKINKARFNDDIGLSWAQIYEETDGHLHVRRFVYDAIIEEHLDQFVSKHFSHMSRRPGQQPRFSLKNGRGTFLFEVDHINYVEAVGKSTRVHFRDRMVMFPLSITALLQNIKSGSLIRIDRSTVVNILNIATVNRDHQDNRATVLMDDGTHVSVGRQGYHRLMIAIKKEPSNICLKLDPVK